MPHAALVKASEEDLDQLYPGRSVEAVLADGSLAGASMAVVTRGEHGAVANTAGGVETAVPGRPVAVVDTVGAGDTFQAALLAGLKERGCLSRQALEAADGAFVDDLVTFAVQAAAITCSRRGAELPRRSYSACRRSADRQSPLHQTCERERPAGSQSGGPFCLRRPGARPGREPMAQLKWYAALAHTVWKSRSLLFDSLLKLTVFRPLALVPVIV